MTWNYSFKSGFFPSLILFWFVLLQWTFPLILTRIRGIKCFESSIFQKIKQAVVRREWEGFCEVLLKVVQVQMRPSLQAGYIEDTCPTYWSPSLVFRSVNLLAYDMPQASVFFRISPFGAPNVHQPVSWKKKMFAELYVQPVAWQI